MESSTLKLVELAAAAAEEKNAQELVVLDLSGISSVTDCFIICSGSSDRNIKAISDNVKEKLKEAGTRPLGIEGHREGTWILMDYVDFVLHIFHREKRLEFAIEDLWKDAKRLSLSPAVASPAKADVVL